MEEADLVKDRGREILAVLYSLSQNKSTLYKYFVISVKTPSQPLHQSLTETFYRSILILTVQCLEVDLSKYQGNMGP